MSEKKSLFGIHISRDSRDRVNLSITDAISGDHLLRLDFSLEEYARATTGLYGQSIEGKINLDAVIGQKRETKNILIPKDYPHYSDDTKGMVQLHFEQNYSSLGWILHDDGTRTQQRNHQGHQYVIKRYVDVDDISKHKKDY